MSADPHPTGKYGRQPDGSVVLSPAAVYHITYLLEHGVTEPIVVKLNTDRFRKMLADGIYQGSG